MADAGSHEIYLKIFKVLKTQNDSIYVTFDSRLFLFFEILGNVANLFLLRPESRLRGAQL